MDGLLSSPLWRSPMKFHSIAVAIALLALSIVYSTVHDDASAQPPTEPHKEVGRYQIEVLSPATSRQVSMSSTRLPGTYGWGINRGPTRSSARFRNSQATRCWMREENPYKPADVMMGESTEPESMASDGSEKLTILVVLMICFPSAVMTVLALGRLIFNSLVH